MSPNASVRFLRDMTTTSGVEKEPLWECVLKALPVILVVSIVTTWIHELGWLKGFENTTLDTWLRLRPLSAEHVFIVGIRNDDYNKLFGGKSPLNANKVVELVEAIDKGKPKVIVVDLDTSNNDFKKVKLPELTSKVVWAKAPIDLRQEDEFAHTVNDIPPEKDSPHKFKEGPFLGQFEPPKSKLSGISFFPQDSDGIIRRYKRKILVQEAKVPTATHLTDTLPWAAVKAYKGGPSGGDTSSTESLLLSFSGGPKYLPRMSAADMLVFCDTPGWQQLVGGKIVLLGGYYTAARDNFTTPIGRLAGVEILAETIESELQRGGIHTTSNMVLIISQIAASLLLVISNWYLSQGFSQAARFLLIPITAFAFSLISFLSFSLWFDFIPALVAVQLHYLFGHISKVRKQNVELYQLNEKLAQTKHELALAINRGAEEERKRLAHELHDDTLGHLFNVSLTLDPIAHGSKDTEAAGKALDTVREAMTNIREIMVNMYPPVLEKYGFMAAIDELVSHAQSPSTKVELIDKTQKLADGFDKDTKLCLYRIAQQALTNMQKHAQATHVKVIMESKGTDFILSIIDNGVGMINPEGRADSYGLQSMKDKAEMLWATIDWISPPADQSSGTEVRLNMPDPNVERRILASQQ